MSLTPPKAPIDILSELESLKEWNSPEEKLYLRIRDLQSNLKHVIDSIASTQSVVNYQLGPITSDVVDALKVVHGDNWTKVWDAEFGKLEALHAEAQQAADALTQLMTVLKDASKFCDSFKGKK